MGLDSQDSGRGIVDLDLKNSDNSGAGFCSTKSGILGAGFDNSTTSFGAEINNTNSSNSVLPLAAEFSNTNSQDLESVLDNSTSEFTKSKQGFINGNNKELQQNDLNSTDSVGGALSAFPTAVKKTNKYETDAVNQYCRMWCKKAA